RSPETPLPPFKVEARNRIPYALAAFTIQPFNDFNDMPLLAGKTGIVFGVANKRSIAWAIAQAWAREGANLAFTYQGERLKDNVEELAGTFGSDTPILACDVSRDDEIARVFHEARERFGRLDLLLHS